MFHLRATCTELTNLTCLPTETGLTRHVSPKALSLPNPLSKTFKGPKDKR